MLSVTLPIETTLAGCSNGTSGLKRKEVQYKKYILKNGAVFIDGKYVKADMEVTGGVITRLSTSIDPMVSPDTKMMDCTDLYISPGWVDLHCHIGGVGVDLDILGPEMGVTALVEAGTYGPETFPAFMDEYYNQSRIPIYLFLNVRKNGIQVTNILFDSAPGVEDVEGAQQLVATYPNIIKGLKVRLDSMNTSGDNPAFLAKVTAELGAKLKLPVAYHLGNPDPSITDFLQNAKSGDIIAHFLRQRNNSIINASGRIRPEVMDAKSKGVCFDVAHGVASFEFDSAKRALDQGFTDFTISSDLWLLPSWARCRTFSNVASKFLALGLPIEDVTYKISSRPREMLNIPSRIEINKPIDLTVFSLREGDFEYSDTSGNELSCAKRIIPEYTLINNTLIRAGNRDRQLFDID